jgi:hypothetical protein
MLGGWLPLPANADPNYDPADALESGVYKSVLALWAPKGDAPPALANLATGFAVIAQAKQDYRAFAAAHQSGALAAAVKATSEAFSAAFAAVDVYFYRSLAPLVPDGYKRVDNNDHASLGKLGIAGAKILVDDASGFYSAIYASGAVGAQGTKYIVANRGTDDGFGSVSLDHGFQLSISKDAWANLDQNLGLKNQQYQEALDAARAIAAAADKSHGSVIFAGHSLGGGLASAQALVTGRRAYVFNPSGVSAATVGGKIQDALKEIVVYVYRGNWLDDWQRTGLAAQPLGRMFEIDHLHVKPGPGAAYDNASDWHLLNFVIPGMLGMLKTGKLKA